LHGIQLSREERVMFSSRIARDGDVTSNWTARNWSTCFQCKRLLYSNHL